MENQKKTNAGQGLGIGAHLVEDISKFSRETKAIVRTCGFARSSGDLHCAKKSEIGLRGSDLGVTLDRTTTAGISGCRASE